MITDIRTVAWKEWKELFARQGRFGGGAVNFALVLGVFGVGMPWQFGRAWMESPTMLLYWAWVPLFMLAHMVADSVAGERERHTLETLLASRLPDRAILFGKIGAAVAFSIAITVGSLAVGAVTVNVLFGRGGLLFYRPGILLGSLVLSLLGSTLTAGTGVLVSLRSATVRQAGQVMGLAVFGILFVPIIAVRALASHWRTAGGPPSPEAIALLGLAALGCLVLTVAAVLAAAMARFRRSRLLLD